MPQYKRKNKKVFIIAIAVFLLITIFWIIWGNISIQTSRFTIISNDLPIEFNGFSIAHISDLHNTQIGIDNAELINILLNEKPDIIVITGDLIDSNHTDVQIALSFAEQALEIAPCYYVTGNHEFRAYTQYIEMKEKLEEIGICVLENEAVMFEQNGAFIQIIGLKDPEFFSNENNSIESIIETNLSKLKSQNTYTILLSHRPEYFEIYKKHNINLVLSGHTHGGQFRLPFIGGLFAPGQGFFPEYDAGLYVKNETSMIISRGIGNSAIPLRFNNRPEIIIIKLNSSN